MSPPSPAAPAQIDWRQNELFAGLTAEDLAALEPLVRQQEFLSGQTILHEGDLGEEFYLIERGGVEVFKENDRFVIARQSAGESFGTMALVDQKPRSASVRAGPDGCATAVLNIQSLHQRGPQAEITLLRNLLKRRSSEVRRTSAVAVNALRQQLEESLARLALGSFVGYVLVIMCFYGFVLRESLDLAKNAGITTLVTVAILMIYAGSLFIMMRRSGYPLAVYGLTLEHWPRAVAQSLVWSAGFMAVLVAGKAVAWALMPHDPAQPFWRLAFAREPLGEIVSDAILYGCFAPVQELVARGALQGSLMKLLSGKRVEARAILISTLAFTATHLHLSIGFAIVATIPSIFWGILFARQRSLLGVSLSHLLIGWFAVYVLGLPGVK